ncbi:MAG: IPTL-CTERM sorting domain-containing protein [Deltaproteobacteria bacterium]|nr:IPTL-CTERM sorting domain-containing protein [Deltaproteobacteria bacterium]
MAAIPTLSQWGLILLALLGSTMGTIAIGRRHLATAGTLMGTGCGPP